MLKFGTQNDFFGYFWARISKSYCYIWNQHPRICLIAKFCEKTKMLKFGTKNALFGYFWARILRNYCHIWNQHPQFAYLQNFAKKQKCLILGPKMPYLGIFWARIKKKNYCHTWNQHAQICQKLVFNSYSEFCCRVPLFLKVRGPLFLKILVRVLVRFVKFTISGYAHPGNSVFSSNMNALCLLKVY